MSSSASSSTSSSLTSYLLLLPCLRFLRRRRRRLLPLLCRCRRRHGRRRLFRVLLSLLFLFHHLFLLFFFFVLFFLFFFVFFFLFVLFFFFMLWTWKMMDLHDFLYFVALSAVFLPPSFPIPILLIIYTGSSASLFSVYHCLSCLQYVKNHVSNVLCQIFLTYSRNVNSLVLVLSLLFLFLFYLKLSNYLHVQSMVFFLSFCRTAFLFPRLFYFSLGDCPAFTVILCVVVSSF